MDKVLVTGLLVAASVITVIILFGVFRTSIQESGNSATGMQGQVALEAETGAKILEVIGIGDGTVFDIWAKNIGSAEILPIENLVLSIMDMNGTSYEYIEYGPSDPLKRTWQLVGSDARWLPGKTLQLRGKLFLSSVTSEEWILSIDTLRDSSDAFIFNVTPNLPVTPQPTIVATATPTPAPGPTPTPGPIPTPTPAPTPSGSCTPTPPGAAPVLNSIATNIGYPRQMLAINGDTSGASIIWGAGTSTETTITTGAGGTRYFQIPDSAAPAIYPVALRAGANTSNIVCVTVKASSGTFPAPRIEDIGLHGRTGTDLAFTVAAANLDADATVTVNGVSIPNSTLWSALPVAYQLSHIPATFGYPIYHYAQIKGVLQNPTIGSVLNVVITNHDGQSSSKSYTLPARWEDLDSDSDGLLDRWEDGVYTAPGGGTVNLAAMGVSKYKKDILMETDWIAATAPGSAGVAYDDSIFTIAIDFFANGPVLNPDGTRGINLISDHGQGGVFTGGGTVLTPDHERMDYSTCPSPWTPQPCSNFVTFMTYKNSSFATERNGLFHYQILGKKTGGGGGGGEARFPFSPPSAGCPECGGDNLFVNFPSMPSSEFAAVIVHEMGHDIGLAHGGIWPNPDHQNWKPNFHSIMNYRYTTSGVPPGCDLTGVNETNYRGGGPSTFSSGTLKVIQESFVDENLGVCDRSPSDLSGDGRITAGPMDIPGATYTRGPTTHTDFDQWGNIVLDFAACWPNPQGLVRRATCN